MSYTEVISLVLCSTASSSGHLAGVIYCFITRHSQFTFLSPPSEMWSAGAAAIDSSFILSLAIHWLLLTVTCPSVTVDDGERERERERERESCIHWTREWRWSVMLLQEEGSKCAKNKEREKCQRI